MYAFNLATNQEIYAPKSKQTATERVGAQILKNFSKVIKDFQLGKETSYSKGEVRWSTFPADLIFEDCKFYNITFSGINKVKFKNCEFLRCSFYSPRDITFIGCKIKDYNIKGGFRGECNFLESTGYGTTSNDLYKDKANLIVVKCNGDLHLLKDRFLEHKKRFEERKNEELNLRKRIKYGYKIVNTPVLVKLSFPEDTKIVNLSKDKSRANKAFVEKITILNNFEGEGVTNTDYNITEYKVGEVVYPDLFDPNPAQDCGKGIHFCKDWKKVSDYVGLNSHRQRMLEKLMENEKD